MLAAAALGALGAQLAEIRAVKADWFVGAGRVDQEDVSLPGGGGITSIYGLAPHLGATSVALLPEATAQLTSPTPASPRRQAAGSEGHAPARRPQLALAACIN